MVNIHMSTEKRIDDHKQQEQLTSNITLPILIILCGLTIKVNECEGQLHHTDSLVPVSVVTVERHC